MKQLYILLLASGLVFAGCGSDEEPEPDNETEGLRATGFICTIGYNAIDQLDTITLRVGNSGFFTITDYTHTAEAGGFLERPKDIWKLETSGDNNWYLRNNAGKYISFSDSFVDPVNENPNKYGYSYDLDDFPTENSVFLRNRDGNHFYLEPKVKRGFYFVTRPSKGMPDDQRHARAFFLPAKQMWFFMP